MLNLTQQEKHDIIKFIQNNSCRDILNWSGLSGNEIKKDILLWSVVNNNRLLAHEVLATGINLHEIKGIVLSALLSHDDYILSVLMSYKSVTGGSCHIENSIISLPPILTDYINAFKIINSKQDAYKYVNRAVRYNLINKDDVISLMLLCIDNDNCMLNAKSIYEASTEIKQTLKVIFSDDHDVNKNHGHDNLFEYVCGTDRLRSIIEMANDIDTDGANNTVINNSWRIMLSAIMAISNNKSYFDNHIRKFIHNIARLDSEDSLNSKIKILYSKSTLSEIHLSKDSVIQYPKFIIDSLELMGKDWNGY